MDMAISKVRAYRTYGVLLMICCLALIGAGIAAGAPTVTFMTSAGRTEGTVVELTRQVAADGGRRNRDLRENWHPVVEFTVGGRQYSFTDSDGSNPPAYREGQAVPVAYAADNPADAQIAAFGEELAVPLGLGGLGLVFATTSAVILAKARRIKRQRDWLRKHGREVWAIPHVDIARSVTINKQHPYVVLAAWQDESNGRTYTATSDYFRRDPGPTLHGRTHVRVLYDPDEPARNMIDLDAGVESDRTG